jgi:hypothetical protein
MIGLPHRTRAPSDSQAKDQQAMYYYTYISAFSNTRRALRALLRRFCCLHFVFQMFYVQLASSDRFLVDALQVPRTHAKEKETEQCQR